MLAVVSCGLCAEGVNVGGGEDVVQTDKAIWFCCRLSALPR